MPNQEINTQKKPLPADNPLGFLLDEGLKATAKVQKNQIEEAAAQGVPAQNIIAKLLEMNGAGQPRQRPGIIESFARGGLAAQGLDPDAVFGTGQQSADLGALSSLLNAATNAQRFEQDKQEFEQNQELLRNLGVLGGAGDKVATPARVDAAVEEMNEGFSPEVSKITPGGPVVDFDTKKEVVERSFDLASKFENLQEVKEFKTVKTQVDIMDTMLHKALAGDRDSNLALDQALIITYNKILDPTSVVRESEYARTPEGIAFLKRFPALVEKMKKGGVGITDSDRIDLVRGAKIMANVRGEAFNDARKRFKERTKASKANDKIVFGGFDEFQPFSDKNIKFAGDTGTIMQDANGNIARVFKDGRVVEQGQDGF